MLAYGMVFWNAELACTLLFMSFACACGPGPGIAWRGACHCYGYSSTKTPTLYGLEGEMAAFACINIFLGFGSAGVACLLAVGHQVLGLVVTRALIGFGKHAMMELGRRCSGSCCRASQALVAKITASMVG